MTSDVLILIKKTVTTDAYHNEKYSESERTVFCEVESISQSEFYAAANTELNPEYRFRVFFGDYQGERVCKYNGSRYAIYRTFRSGDDLELYVERQVGA